MNFYRILRILPSIMSHKQHTYPEFTLSQIVSILYRKKWTIFILSSIITLLILGVISMRPQEYRTTAYIETGLNPENNRPFEEASRVIPRLRILFEYNPLSPEAHLSMINGFKVPELRQAIYTFLHLEAVGKNPDATEAEIHRVIDYLNTQHAPQYKALIEKAERAVANADLKIRALKERSLPELDRKIETLKTETLPNAKKAIEEVKTLQIPELDYKIKSLEEHSIKPLKREINHLENSRLKTLNQELTSLQKELTNLRKTDQTDRLRLVMERSQFLLEQKESILYKTLPQLKKELDTLLNIELKTLQREREALLSITLPELQKRYDTLATWNLTVLNQEKEVLLTHQLETLKLEHSRALAILERVKQGGTTLISELKTEPIPKKLPFIGILSFIGVLLMSSFGVLIWNFSRTQGAPDE